MTIIEPHIHMYSRTTDDYQKMYNFGIRACVEPSFWLGAYRKYPETFFDYFELILDFETIRARRFGIDHYCAISMNPKEAENAQLAKKVIDNLEPFLKHPRCVALGEIGFNDITKNEGIAFERQLNIANTLQIPVIVHLPHLNKKEGVKRTIDIIKNEGIKEELVVIDHNTEESMPYSRKTNCWTGMTVYPISKLTPLRVSELLNQYGYDKMLINGSADWGISNPVSVVEVGEFLKKNNHSSKKIETLLFDNPNKFYSNSKNWKPELSLIPIQPNLFQR